MRQISGRSRVSFKQYMTRRGYMFLTFDQAFVKIINKSFSQKSFCGFWRMWNPLSGYLFFLLYSFLGGNKKRPYAIFFVFILSGFVFHDLIIFLVTGSISIIFSVTFLIYSLIYNIEHKLFELRKRVKFYTNRKFSLSVKFYILLNMTLLFLPLVIGFIVNSYIFPNSPISRLFH